jgi:spore coat protein A, manganese oxidase
MKPKSKQTDNPAIGSLGDALLVAVPMMVGVIVWWSAVPPVVLAHADDRGLRQSIVTSLLVLPLAALAIGAAAWIARRAHWPDRTWHGRLRLAGVAVGLFGAALLVTTPVQHAVLGSLAPGAVPEPNLAAVHYDASADPSGLAAAAHEAMLDHTGHSDAARAAMASEFYPTDGAATGSDTAAYAVQDAFLVLLVALPLALLGLYLVARFRPAPRPAGRHRAGYPAGLSRLRPRWAVATATAALLVTGNLVFAPVASAQTGPFTQQLRIPPVLTGSNVTLQMREADVQIMPSGPPTRMWTYNGIFPAPTIRRPSGTTTRVTFRNDLPTSFGEATIHHHGSHSRPSEDGQPDAQLIPPGGQRTYSYEHFEDGEDERAVTQWYHDHRMDVTGRNVWNGLAGFFILDDEFEAALPLPRGEFDVPLMIADRTFDANNQIPYNFSPIGTLGTTFLVNGVPQPFFDVGDRKYRFRILNASNRRPNVIALSNGQPMTQIGTDSGLLPAPVQRTSILLQPAERVEVVIDFSGHLGENITLLDTNTPGPPNAPPPELMQFRVNRDLTDNSQVPATLRPVPDFPEPVEEREFLIEAELDAAGNPVLWTFNGQTFDSARIDADPVLGTTERWTFFNDSPQPHSIHIHDVDWRLDSRFTLAFDAEGNPIPGASLPIPPYEDALKETWSIPAGQGFSVLTTFTDHVGPYVFHCHMLEHEDMALMAQFEVQPAGS